jgi:hypothetical protein
MAASSVFVVVITVSRVTMLTVHVVQMISMSDRHVAALGAVKVRMPFGLDMECQLVFVVVITVCVVHMAVVQVVHVVLVLDGAVTALRTVCMGVFCVDIVCGAHDRSSNGPVGVATHAAMRIFAYI